MSGLSTNGAHENIGGSERNGHVQSHPSGNEPVQKFVKFFSNNIQSYTLGIRRFFGAHDGYPMHMLDV